MSKFSFDVMHKRVFPFMEADDPDIILGAVFGEDVALTRVGGDILASHVDPIVGAIGNIGRLAVHVACNDIAASGIPPRWILLLVLAPRPDDEDLLENIMRDAHRAATEIDVSIVGGHTGYSSGLSRPLVAVAALGTASGRKPVGASSAHVDDLVLVTKGVALEGTAILAYDFTDVALAARGATAMHDVTRGGILETLLEIAYRSQVGIEIDGVRLPVRPVVSRFAEAFQFDPLRMISSGTLVATVPPKRAADVRSALEEMGMPFAFAGLVRPGSGVRVLREGQVERYTGIHCEEDELARLWTLYPRGE